MKLAAQTDRVYLATGTPVRNWAHELFMLLRALYPGDKRFSSFWRWVDKWFTVETQERWRGRKKISHRVVGELRDITTWDQFFEANGLPGHWLRREIDDPEVGLALPEQQRISIPVQMGPTQKKAYRSMEKTFLASYDGKTISGVEGGQWSHLMRLASGLCFHPDLGKGPSAKLDALGDLMQPGSGPWVIFAWYQHTVDTIADWADERGFRAAGVHGGQPRRQNSHRIEQFQQGETDVLVGSYPTLGEGHNLTPSQTDGPVRAQRCAGPYRPGHGQDPTVRPGRTDHGLDLDHRRHGRPVLRGCVTAVEEGGGSSGDHRWGCRQIQRAGRPMTADRLWALVRNWAWDRRTRAQAINHLHNMSDEELQRLSADLAKLQWALGVVMVERRDSRPRYRTKWSRT